MPIFVRSQQSSRATAWCGRWRTISHGANSKRRPLLGEISARYHTSPLGCWVYHKHGRQPTFGHGTPQKLIRTTNDGVVVGRNRNMMGWIRKLCVFSLSAIADLWFCVTMNVEQLHSKELHLIPSSQYSNFVHRQRSDDQKKKLDLIYWERAKFFMIQTLCLHS
ncbi:hypothetical protein RRG08_003523 [Elysia crispata]|uniref:Uncharacterized protein n=1 Tax=Elysia crispata TaxID=231223 RepID=A0AAE0Y849_9GAST|nr:hypothetical protein RRG08_003523 [Elysia crispata]